MSIHHDFPLHIIHSSFTLFDLQIYASSGLRKKKNIDIENQPIIQIDP